MGLEFPYGIRVTTPEPIDADRYIADVRSGMTQLVDEGRAFIGLQVYNLEEKILYILTGSTDSDWMVLGDDTGLISALSTEISIDLSTEISIRTSDDVSLTSSLSSESSSRISGDNSLSSSIIDGLSTEISIRTSADTSLTSSLSGESSTRTSADTSLTSSLSSETIYRISADNSLSINLSTETSERTSADTFLSTVISTNTSKITSLSTSVSGEISSRISGDASLTTEISVEISTRASADSSLSISISGESSSRISGDASLTNELSVEISTRASADNSLSSVISTNTSKITSLSTSISGETSSRISGDELLSTSISGETSSRISGDSLLSTSLSSETSSRISGDELLSTSLSSETSYRISGDASLSTSISTETSLRTSVDTSLSTLISNHNHYNLYQPNGTNPFVYTDNSGVLHIDGGIIQSGTSYETHAEKLYTTKDIILVRDGAVSGLGSELAGIQAIKYDGVNDGQLVFDSGGTARVGDVGSLQPLATRIETPTNSHFAYWDSGNTRLDFKSLSISDVNLLSSTLSTETSSRISGDSLLSTSISTETSSRISGDASLSTSLSSETSSRISGDSSLSSSISTETSYRISGDASLSSSISTETSYRISGDASLEVVISQSINDISYTSIYPDAMVIPYDIGGFLSGTTIGEITGRTFSQLFDELLLPTVYSTKDDNLITFSPISPATVEIGSGYTLSSINADYLTGTIYSADDSPNIDLTGDAWRYVFKLPDGTTDGTYNVNGVNSQGHSFSLYNVLLGDNSWSVVVDYSGGTGSYYTNKGVVDTSLDSARLLSSKTKNSNIISSRYRRWWGSGVSGSVPTNSAGVRAITGTTELFYTTGNTTYNYEIHLSDFQINIGSSDQEVYFFIPSGKTVSVRYMNTGNIDITGDFTVTDISVNDAGGTSRGYKKWVQTIGEVGYGENVLYYIIVT